MSPVDPFTAASATYLNALRLGARTGPAFEITGRRIPTGHVVAVLIGVAVAIALLIWESLP